MSGRTLNWANEVGDLQKHTGDFHFTDIFDNRGRRSHDTQDHAEFDGRPVFVDHLPAKRGENLDDYYAKWPERAGNPDPDGFNRMWKNYYPDIEPIGGALYNNNRIKAKAAGYHPTMTDQFAVPIYKKPTQPVEYSGKKSVSVQKPVEPIQKPIQTTMAKPVMGYEERPQWSKDRAMMNRMNQYAKPKEGGRLFTAHQNLAKEGRETRTYNPGDNTGERKVFSPKYQNGGVPKYQGGDEVFQIPANLMQQHKNELKLVESANGVLMKNPSTSASGFYQQLFKEIEGMPEMKGITRDQFIADTTLQNKIYDKRYTDQIPDIPGTSKTLKYLYEKYEPQIKEKKYTPLDVAGIINLLGREGSRQYFGPHLRDKKPLSKTNASLFSSKNHTPEEYVEKMRTIRPDNLQNYNYDTHSFNSNSYTQPYKEGEDRMLLNLKNREQSSPQRTVQRPFNPEFSSRVPDNSSEQEIPLSPIDLEGINRIYDKETTKEEIGNLQNKLDSLGYNIGSKGVDSLAGGSTELALKQFALDQVNDRPAPIDVEEPGIWDNMVETFNTAKTGIKDFAKDAAEVVGFQNGGEVEQRRGVRENPDGSVSSHLMRAEYVDGRGWVGFPSLFQDSKPYADDSENWIDMSEEEDWMKVYKEAEKRGEVYDFGDDREAALRFGEGSWKDSKVEMQDGGEVLPEELPHHEIVSFPTEREPHIDPRVPKWADNTYYKKLYNTDIPKTLAKQYSYWSNIYKSPTGLPPAEYKNNYDVQAFFNSGDWRKGFKNIEDYRKPSHPMLGDINPDTNTFVPSELNVNTNEEIAEYIAQENIPVNFKKVERIPINPDGFAPGSATEFADKVVIPSGNITMKDMQEPILANGEMLMPGDEAQFDTDYVVEEKLPKAQDGLKVEGNWNDPVLDPSSNYSQVKRQKEVEDFARQVIKKEPSVFDITTQEGRDNNPLSYFPLTGDALDAMSFGEAVDKKDYETAALYGLFGAIPGAAGPIVNKVKPYVNKLKSLFKASPTPAIIDMNSATVGRDIAGDYLHNIHNYNAESLSQLLDESRAFVKAAPTDEFASEINRKIKNLEKGVEKDMKLQKIAKKAGRTNGDDTGKWLADSYIDSPANEQLGHVTTSNSLWDIVFKSNGNMKPYTSTETLYFNRGGSGQLARTRLMSPENQGGAINLIFDDKSLKKANILPDNSGGELTISQEVSLKHLYPEAKKKVKDLLLNEAEYRGIKLTQKELGYINDVLGISK